MKQATWYETTLGEQLTFQRGYDITKKEQKPGPYPVVSSSGVKSYHTAFKVDGPGVVIGRKGTLGTAFYLDQDFWPHDTTLWVKDFHGNHPKFAYFFVQCMGFEQYDCGASNPTLNRNHIHKLPIGFPPLPTQRKIASILSAYDDLIENNTRRIAILEEMAQAIYREWFVNFRFPGHENVKLVESPIGKIPEGWEATKLSEICERITSGGTPRTKTAEYWGGDIPWLASGETGNPFVTVTAKTITQEGVDNSSTRFVRAGSTVIASAGQGKTRGQTSMLLIDSYINQSVIALTANTERVSDNFLFFDLFRRYREFRQISDGSSRGSLTTKLLDELNVVLPPYKVVHDFDGIAEPIVRTIESCIRKNKVLTTLRDLLLPKLISGQLDVEDLDIDTGLPAEALEEATA